MAIIWTYIPFVNRVEDKPYHQKLEKWLDENCHVQIKWIQLEVHNNDLYIDGISNELVNLENEERLKGNIKEGQRRFTKIAVFETEEEKVKFILKWG